MIKSFGPRVLRHGLLALSGVWVAHVALETKRLQGWYEAQAPNGFRYPGVELALFALALGSGLMLARSRFWPLASLVALVSAACCEMMFIGMTR